MTKAATRVSSVKTPGMPDPAPDEQETDADAAMAAAPGFDDSAPLPGQANLRSMDANAMPPDVQAFIADAVARGIAQGLAAARGTTAGSAPAAELPDQSEINPRKITVPTLSKQGYVIPIGYGEPKHLARE